MKHELVMYTRTIGCPYVSLARRVLAHHNVPYREIYIDHDDAARQRVLKWTGFLSVPTLVAAPPGQDLPTEEPPPLRPGSSPRGINRGAMITEPGEHELEEWLVQNGFLEQHSASGRGT